MNRRMRDAQIAVDLEALSRRSAAGEERAFGELVEHTHRVVYRLALRILGARADAEDVVQETFTRAWQGLATVRDHGAVLGWLCQVARHVSYERLRQQRRRPMESLERGGDERSLAERV